MRAASLRRDQDRSSEIRSAHLPRPQFENNLFTEMCSSSEAGSYVRLADFVNYSTLGLRVTKKKPRAFHQLIVVVGF